MALSQRDVKRVLAYSTIENTGLVTLAIGAALLAASRGRPGVAALAWTAALQLQGLLLDGGVDASPRVGESLGTGGQSARPSIRPAACS